jgi:hypothetical protein
VKDGHVLNDGLAKPGGETVTLFADGVAVAIPVF